MASHPQRLAPYALLAAASLGLGHMHSANSAPHDLFSDLEVGDKVTVIPGPGGSAITKYMDDRGDSSLNVVAELGSGSIKITTQGGAGKIRWSDRIPVEAIATVQVHRPLR